VIFGIKWINNYFFGGNGRIEWTRNGSGCEKLLKIQTVTITNSLIFAQALNSIKTNV